MTNPVAAPGLRPETSPVIIVGAGLGGLTAALWLVASGQRVIVMEKHGWVGGKARALPSPAGPVAAGPTVLTLKHVFERAFEASGSRLGDHVELHAQHILARHFWPDGSTLDLTVDPAETTQNIQNFSGHRSAAEFQRFHQETAALFSAFDEPMMQAASPSVMRLAQIVMRTPALMAAMGPGRVLSAHLRRRFWDPRLAQLFARYATYVGGSPLRTPALLSLIWQAEAHGVWTIQGGIAALAAAMAERIEALGGEIRTGCGVERIATENGAVTSVVTDTGEEIRANTVVFNGDPNALSRGTLGQDVAHAAPTTRKAARSLSARVWSFAAQAQGVDLAHHNVFFAQDPDSEFLDLQGGQMPRGPTLYVCAQDRGHGPVSGLERFEIILNAPSLDDAHPVTEEGQLCHQRTFPALRQMGLHLSPEPSATSSTLTTPTDFEALFPDSRGSLYGQSPHGMTASLKRPRARTGIKGLYLCGGGTHPGAGVPMAALSGQHAAGAILNDLSLTLTSPQTATRGGTWTGSVTTAKGPSR